MPLREIRTSQANDPEQMSASQRASQSQREDDAASRKNVRAAASRTSLPYSHIVEPPARRAQRIRQADRGEAGRARQPADRGAAEQARRRGQAARRHPDHARAQPQHRRVLPADGDGRRAGAPAGEEPVEIHRRPVRQEAEAEAHGRGRGRGRRRAGRGRVPGGAPELRLGGARLRELRHVPHGSDGGLHAGAVRSPRPAAPPPRRPAARATR